MGMKLLDFEMKLVSIEGDLNGMLSILELSQQRGDAPERFQAILFLVQEKIKSLGQQLVDLGAQKVEVLYPAQSIAEASEGY